MPQVPRANPDQVQLRGLPSVQPVSAPAAAFGGGPAADAMGQSISQTAKVAGELFAKAKKEADETAMVDFDAKATKLQNDLLYHPENGALNKQSADALSIYDPTMKSYEKGVEELVKGLSNDDQRNAARRLAARRAAAIDGSLQQHIAQENRKHIFEVAKTNISAARELAVNGKNDPTVLKDSLFQIGEAVTSSGRTLGLHPDTIEQTKKAAVSDTVSSIVAAYLAEGNPKEADGFLQLHGDKLEAKDRERVLPAVRAKVFEFDSTVIASTATNTFREDGTVKVEDAIKTAKAEAKAKGYDPVQTDHVVQATVHAAQMKDMQTKERKDTQVQSFFATALDMEKKGAPYEFIRRQLFDVQGLAVGMSLTERQKLEKTLIDLHTNKGKFLDESIASNAQKSAAAKMMEYHVKKAFPSASDTTKMPDGTEVPTQQYYLSVLKEQTATMPVKDWVPYAAKQMEHFVTEKGIFWDSRKLRLEQTIEDKAKAEKNEKWVMGKNGAERWTRTDKGWVPAVAP